MFPNSLRSLLFLAGLFMGYTSYSQNFKIEKVGILYNRGFEENFLFDDLDYNYKTSVVKLQLSAPLYTKNWFSINLLGQPQIHRAKHQLHNKYFVKPDTEDFEEKREKFTQKKTISLYGVELSAEINIRLFSKTYFTTTFGVGGAFIDVETERLARGFTFIENGSLGFTQKFQKSEIYIGSNLGHVSNLNFKLPNDGYNILGIELGYKIYIN